ncbi:hypothetical protein [Helicobacter pylori]|uniref:Uncharacterized protein n=1 Tax=Helicobacter pylori (strain SouthAfrica7) TaxID=907239 RepID=E8QVU8_HELPW|nr:hypothetical protein [Helicobacter pylori]ADU84569.1 hypothetical protein HPSA_02820 [Helicobacter pylori SouthAfrica7]
MEATQELDFLELTIKRIKSKEIRLFNINQMLHKKYKGILQKYKVEKECVEFMEVFLTNVGLSTRPRSLNIYQRLYIKLVNLTPISPSMVRELRCSDFVVKDDYCLVANKYFLFIPLFIEAKGMAKDDEKLIKRACISKLEVTDNNKRHSPIRELDYIKRELFKGMGIYGMYGNEIRFIFFLYLLHLGLYEIAVATTFIKLTETIRRELGLKPYHSI